MFAGKCFYQSKMTMTPSLSNSYTPLHFPNFLVQLSLFLFHLHHHRKVKIEITVTWRNRTLVPIFRSLALPGTKHSGAAPCPQGHSFEPFHSAPTLLFLDLLLPGCCSATRQPPKALSLQSPPWHNGKKRSVFNHLLILSCLFHC